MRENNWLAMGGLLVFMFALGCNKGSDEAIDINDNDSETSADGDSDADSDSDSDGDGDSDEDTPDGGPIVPICDCAETGTSLDNMLCAVELCVPELVIEQDYTSPTIADADLVSTREAVNHFGDAANDLAPLLYDSYALVATGTAKGTDHNVELNAEQAVADPVTPNASRDAFDSVNWRIKLRAPSTAGGFQIHYVFFSEEYDEYVGSQFNDKFYILLEAASTNNGDPTVINFTGCRAGYDGDKECDEELADMGVCELGDSLCYIAINTALSECCWYEGCPDGTFTTQIDGTGYSCGTEDVDKTISEGGEGYLYGSSTGWLRTEWPIDPDEEFTVTFHIHDTADAKFDSEVIIDKFLFVTDPDPGTHPI